MRDSGPDIAGEVGLPVNTRAIAVGLADSLSALESSAAHHHAPTRGPVVATDVGVDPRCAAEFAHPHQHDVIEHATLGQVGRQCGDALVELRQSLGRERVEDVVVEVPASHADLDERNSRLDQPAGHQQALAEAAGAVGVASFLRLLGDLESLHLLARHQVDRLLVDLLVTLGHFATLGVDEVGLDDVEHPQPLAQSILLVAEAGVTDLAIAADDKRRVTGSHETGAARRSIHRHEGRDLQSRPLRAQLVADHAAKRRVHHGGIGDERGVHVVATPTVIRLASAHRADHAQLVHLHRRLGHMLADLQVALGLDRLELAAVLRTGLQVPDVDRGRTSAHPHQDAGLLGLLDVLGMSPDIGNELHSRHGRRGRGHVLHEVPSAHALGCGKMHQSYLS